MKKKLTQSLVLALFAMVLLVSSSFAVFPTFAASPTVLDSNTCSSLGNWDAGLSTCTVTSASISYKSTLVIPTGTSLNVSNSVSGGDIGVGPIGLYNSGTIKNAGTINILNSGDFNTGLFNNGTIDNSGTITVSKGGVNSAGIGNVGTIKNSGTITIGNTFSGGTGIGGYGVIDNSGTITIQNNGGSLGIGNQGQINNPGTMIINNSGTSTTGIINSASEIKNSGTMIINNTGTDTIGIVNAGFGHPEVSGEIKNSGTIIISNTGTDTIGIQNFALGIIKNGGTITISNSNSCPSVGPSVCSGDIGIDNYFGIKNSGTIMVSDYTGTGFVPETGSIYVGNPVET